MVSPVECGKGEEGLGCSVKARKSGQERFDDDGELTAFV